MNLSTHTNSPDPQEPQPIAYCDDCGPLYNDESQADYDEGRCRCNLCGKPALEAK